MAEVRMSLEEYDDLVRRKLSAPGARKERRGRAAKSPRKASAYSKRYGAAFKRLAKKNKKKGGGWKAGGFARTQKAAHKAAKK